MSSNGLEAYATRCDPDVQRIYRLTRKTQTEDFGEPEAFDGGGDAGQWVEYDPSLSPDDLTLFYVVITPDPPGDSGDIFVSRRSSPNERFTPGTALSLVNNPLYRDDGPFVSHDGKTLYFASKQEGNYDIYSWQMGSFSSPAPLISVNTPGYHERSPVLSDDGLTIFFASNREGYGKMDLYMRQRSNVEDGFGEMIHPLAETPTPELEYPDAVSRDGCTLWYQVESMGLSRIQTTTRSRD